MTATLVQTKAANVHPPRMLMDQPAVHPVINRRGSWIGRIDEHRHVVARLVKGRLG